ARHTVPMPPLPIAARSSYRPPTTVPGVARSCPGPGAADTGELAVDRPRHEGTGVVTAAVPISEGTRSLAPSVSLPSRGALPDAVPIFREDAPEGKSRASRTAGP